MNKHLITGLALLILVLSACAGAASGTASSAGSNQSDAQAATGQDFANQPLSQPLLLAIGTLKLEDTAYAVQVNQAAALLPLWQAYNALSSSSTTAQVEVDAVLDQIEESLTADQLKAINEMKLTSTSMGEVFQSLGIESNFGRQDGFSGTPDPERRATQQASGSGFQGGRGGEFAQGTGPEGGVGPGGGFGGGGFALSGTPDPELLATRQAMAGGFAGSGQVNPALFQALIDLLESKNAQ